MLKIENFLFLIKYNIYRLYCSDFALFSIVNYLREVKTLWKCRFCYSENVWKTLCPNIY